VALASVSTGDWTLAGKVKDGTRVWTPSDLESCRTLLYSFSFFKWKKFSVPQQWLHDMCEKTHETFLHVTFFWHWIYLLAIFHLDCLQSMTPFFCSTKMWNIFHELGKAAFFSKHARNMESINRNVIKSLYLIKCNILYSMQEVKWFHFMRNWPWINCGIEFHIL
jgi:hypothetical protein